MADLDWTAGYIADLDYTCGYYAELNPLRARLALLQAGLACPDMNDACELGFGQGLSLNLHAAASQQRWAGTDFNPAQASFARELAQASGASATLLDDAFADFAQRTDLPDFDFIGLHGIWTWVSDDNRQVLVDFARRKLKPGGVLYISYNTLPGWSAMAPMRHLLSQYAETMAVPGQGILEKINSALGFGRQLLDSQPAFARAQPQLAEWLQRLGTQNRQYLAHEYFNRDWGPIHFADMAGWLKQAKLSYVGQANTIDNLAHLNLTPAQQQLLGGIPDPVFRETVRDFVLNQPFRRDYWVKGARRLTPPARFDALCRQRVVLQVLRGEVSLKIGSALGNATMNAAIYDPLLDALADQQPHTVGELVQAAARRGIAAEQVIEAVMVLGGTSQLVPAQDEATAELATPACRRINRHLLSRARLGSEIQFLASPVTGGGVSVSAPHQLFLAARQQGLEGRESQQGQESPEEWARWTALAIRQLGRQVHKDGQPVADDAQALAEILRQARQFADRQLPVLKALRVV